MMRAKSSMESAYCMALRARTNSGIAFGSNPLKPLMVVSVITMPARVDAEIVGAVDQPGQAVHQDALRRSPARCRK